MLYSLLADSLVLLHLAFILFGLFGGLLILMRKWWLAIHLPAAVWIAALEFYGWICPLTPLELWLRRAAGETGYSEGFVEHYLLPLIYPSGLTPALQTVLGTIAVLVNLGVYSFVGYRLHRANRTRR